MIEELLYCAVISALQIVSLSVLLFTALSDELLFSRPVNILLMFLLEGVSMGVYAMVFSDNPLFEDLRVVIGVAFNTFSVFFFLVFVRGNRYQNLFVIFVIKNYLDIVSMCVADLKKAYELIVFGNSLWADVLILCIIFAVTLPFAWLFMTKLLRWVIRETRAMNFWRFIWTVPLCFFLLFRFSVYPQMEQQSFISILFVPLIWTVGTFYVYYIILRVFSEMSKNIMLEEQVRMMDLQVEMRQVQYSKLREHWEEMRRVRHDMRHHFLVIQDLAGEEKYQEIGIYMSKLLEDVTLDPSVYLCENATVNALAGYYRQRAETAGTEVDFKLDVPEVCFVKNGDLSVIFGNLLENALEACERQTSGERFIKAIASMTCGNRLAISIENSFSGVLTPLQGTFASAKRSGEHKEPGVGIMSVRTVAQKYLGSVRIHTDENRFAVRVMLYKK